MYWVYAIVFMVSVFLLLRFVFLAVVIDAFLEMKAERPPVARNAPYDALASLYAFMKFRKRKWPTPVKILKALEEEDTPKLLTARALAEAIAEDEPPRTC